ncbi:MAG: hypothetical protein P9M08_08795 [Candidatus Erginobacter occultus]|nr:hypothetical protein [Candidatus Erginobacter occultus]
MKVRKITMGWGILLCLLLVTPVLADVSLHFDLESAGWERNGVYEARIFMRNNASEPVKIAGVQVDFNYDPADFKGVGNTAVALTADYITGYTFAVSEIDRSNEGWVIYQKGITVTGSPNHFTIGANSDYDVVKFGFRVAGDAGLGTSTFSFREGAAVSERLDTGGVRSITGEKPSASVTIVEDTTPPNTYADPAGKTLKFGDSTLVALREVTVPAYDDLERVFYSVGEDGAVPPSVEGTWVEKDGTVQLPFNAQTHPGQIIAVLKFFGRDDTGNSEFAGSDWHTETYIVDQIRPTISDPVLLLPVNGYAKLGGEIRVSFSVDEELAEDPEVTVNNHQFTRISGDKSGPSEYVYSYTTQAGDAEGIRTNSVKAVDLVGNQRTDTSLTVRIDYTPPTYTAISFLPDPAPSGGPLEIKFRASEELDTELTKVYLGRGHGGGEAGFQARDGLAYTYAYLVTGIEESSFVQVHGYDLAGNDSWNTDGWDLIEVQARDIYYNPGSATGTVGVEWKRAD